MPIKIIDDKPAMVCVSQHDPNDRLYMADNKYFLPFSRDIRIRVTIFKCPVCNYIELYNLPEKDMVIPHE